MKRYSDLLPPGYSLKKEILKFVLFAAIFLFGQFLLFGIAYANAQERLYSSFYGVRHLIEGAEIVPYAELIRHKMIGFWAYFLYAVLTSVSYYLSFRVESKSYYVMKRLKSGAELPAHCLTLPLLALFAGILFSALLLFFSVLIYRYATPEVCLPEIVTYPVWEAFL